MNKQEDMQQETSHPTWHQTRYAYQKLDMLSLGMSLGVV